MTTNNLAPPPRRRARTIAIVVAAVVLGLVIGLVVVGVARHNGTGGQATSTTAVCCASHNGAGQLSYQQCGDGASSLYPEQC